MSDRYERWKRMTSESRAEPLLVFYRPLAFSITSCPCPGSLIGRKTPSLVTPALPLSIPTLRPVSVVSLSHALRLSYDHFGRECKERTVGTRLTNGRRDKGRAWVPRSSRSSSVSPSDHRRWAPQGRIGRDTEGTRGMNEGTEGMR